MELITLCGLAVVLIAIWEEFERAVKTVDKMIHSRRLKGLTAADRTDRHHDSMTSLPICLASLPRYQKTA